VKSWATRAACASSREEQYFKSSAEMQALFADVPSALANTVEIAKRCNLTLVLGKPQLPDFPTPRQSNGVRMPIDDYFRQESFEGLEVRLAPLPRRRGARQERPATWSASSSRSTRS
jgi:DNA polymerase-3 subunit alpha